MKKTLFALLIIFCSVYLSAQIPNADMELWDNQPVLLQWETNSRPLTVPAYNPYVVVKDTDRYTGNYSANLIGNNVFHSWARTTFAANQHPASLTLFYKLNFPPCVNDPGYFQQDTVSVLVELLHNSVVVDQGNWQMTGGSNMLWSQLTVPVSNNSSVFDSCRITLTGGKIYGGCGFAAAATEFKVDHLSLNYLSSCANTGIVRDGVESGCLLIDTGTGSWLLPCNVSLASMGFAAGDTIHFSFISNPSCVSFCMQGTTVDITCIDTGVVQPTCNLSVVLQKHNPSSYVATNGWAHAISANGTAPYYFVWSNGVSGTGKDSTTQLSEGNYCVTVSDANGCTATACASLAGPHICIDSGLLCPQPQGLCCDAPIESHVCGCDSVTYTNGCIATYWYGVTSYYQGNCVISGLPDVSETQRGLFIWPVPSNNILNVVYDLNRSGNTEMRLINALGETIKTYLQGHEISGRHKMEIDLNGVAAGFYFVEIKTENERKIKSFVKE